MQLRYSQIMLAETKSRLRRSVFRETCLRHRYRRQSHIGFKTLGDNKSFKIENHLAPGSAIITVT